MEDLKQRTVSGILWSFLDKAGSQFAGFIITILLARLLDPKEFGLVAMASVFFAISRVFIDSGLRDSLIQKKHATSLDYNTVFYFNIVMGLGIYGIIFFAAPFIADFYGYSDLTFIVRILAINVVIHSFSIVQIAILTKELKFKLLLKVRMPAVLVSGLVAVYMAYSGFGIWSLIVQMVLESFLFNLLLWIVTSWKPNLMFRYDVFQFHWKHGSRLLLGEIINMIYRNVYFLVIGKVFSPTKLGLYSRADSFMVVIFNNTTGLVQSVSYPTLAQVQEDDAKLKIVYRKILQTTLLVTLPIYLFFILQAEEIIHILLTDKWREAAPILVVLSLAGMLGPFNSINLNILKVKRRTDLFLRLQIITKVFLILIVLCTSYFGFEFLILTNLFGAGFALFVNNYYANKMIRYTLGEQLKDILPLIVATFVCYGIVFLLTQSTLFLGLPLLKLVGNGVAILLTFGAIVYLVRPGFIKDNILLMKSLVRGRAPRKSTL